MLLRFAPRGATDHADEDEPQALTGFTAYVAKGQNRKQRPIMFACNGGAHRRVNNEYSIIDEADLVMIDPVGTGFAGAVGDAAGEDLWGVDQDIRFVSEFIVQYLTESGRWHRRSTFSARAAAVCAPAARLT